MALKDKIKKVVKSVKKAEKVEAKLDRVTMPEELHVDYDPNLPLNKQRHLR